MAASTHPYRYLEDWVFKECSAQSFYKAQGAVRVDVATGTSNLASRRQLSRCTAACCCPTMKLFGYQKPCSPACAAVPGQRAVPPFRSPRRAPFADGNQLLVSVLGGLFQGSLRVTMEFPSASPHEFPRPLLRPLLPSTAPRGEATSLPPKRHRVSLACAACRARKTKVAHYRPTDQQGSILTGNSVRWSPSKMS